MDPTHDPDGATATSKSASENTSTWCRTTGSASLRYPVFTCICPQQTCAGGKTTSCPSRSSSETVAFATSGKRASPRQVAIKAMRMGTSIVRSGTAAGWTSSIRWGRRPRWFDQVKHLWQQLERLVGGSPVGPDEEPGHLLLP